MSVVVPGTAESLHRMRGRIDVALDIIGRCILAHESDTPVGDRILEGLCVASRELADVADALEGELRARLQPVA